MRKTAIKYANFQFFNFNFRLFNESVGKPIVMDDEEFCHQLDRLEKACEEETEDMKDIVASVVPTYRRKK